MNQVSTPSFENYEVLDLLKKLRAQKLSQIVQPIRYRDSQGIDQFLTTPFNHKNGSVRCVFDYSQIQADKYKCQLCNKTFGKSELYFDLTLELWMRQVRENQNWSKMQSIVLRQDGNWQPVIETYDEFVNSISQSKEQINKSFEDLEIALHNKYLQQENKQTTVVAPMTDAFDQIFRLIRTQIKINPNDRQKFGDILISRQYLQYPRQLNEVEIYFLDHRKFFHGRLALEIDDSLTSISFHQDSIMYCSSEWIVIIGVPLSTNKDVEMSNCYVCKVDKFIEWFTFGDKIKYIPLKQIKGPIYPRIEFNIAEHNGYLYIVGGHSYTCNIEQSEQFGILKDSKPTQCVLQVERIKLDDNIFKAQWEVITQLPVGRIQSDSLITTGGRLVVDGGVTIDQYQTYANKKGLRNWSVYNIETKAWSNVGQKEQENVQLKLAQFKTPPEVKNNQDYFVSFGGLGFYDENRIRFQSKKEIYMMNALTSVSVTLQPKLVDEYDRMAIYNDLISNELLCKLLSKISQRSKKNLSAGIVRTYKEYDPKKDGQYRARLFAMDYQDKQFEVYQII